MDDEFLNGDHFTESASNNKWREEQFKLLLGRFNLSCYGVEEIMLGRLHLAESHGWPKGDR